MAAELPGADTDPDFSTREECAHGNQNSVGEWCCLQALNDYEEWALARELAESARREAAS